MSNNRKRGREGCLNAMRVISVKDFAGEPGGAESGAEFCQDWLLPVFKTGEKVEVDLDGVLGYPSSFLDEAFGGLVRRGVPIDRVYRQLKLKTVYDGLLGQIEASLERACRKRQREANHHHP